jgi:hypothetical protein
MKAKDVLCSECGNFGELFGSDYRNEEGPYGIQCTGCGKETVVWAYPREAWRQWKTDNQKALTCPE